MLLTVMQLSHYIIMTRELTLQKGLLMSKPTKMSHNNILLCVVLPCTQNTLERADDEGTVSTSKKQNVASV